MCRPADTARSWVRGIESAHVHAFRVFFLESQVNQERTSSLDPFERCAAKPPCWLGPCRLVHPPMQGFSMRPSLDFALNSSPEALPHLHIQCPGTAVMLAGSHCIEKGSLQ